MRFPLFAVVAGIVLFAAPAAHALPAASTFGEAARQQAAQVVPVQAQIQRKRPPPRMERRGYRRDGRRHWTPGRSYRHAPRGWNRYHSRPRDWRRRGCVSVGPVWFCP